jgi:hypothetical protein
MEISNHDVFIPISYSYISGKNVILPTRRHSTALPKKFWPWTSHHDGFPRTEHSRSCRNSSSIIWIVVIHADNDDRAKKLWIKSTHNHSSQPLLSVYQIGIFFVTLAPFNRTSSRSTEYHLASCTHSFIEVVTFWNAIARLSHGSIGTLQFCPSIVYTYAPQHSDTATTDSNKNSAQENEVLFCLKFLFYLFSYIFTVITEYFIYRIFKSIPYPLHKPFEMVKYSWIQYPYQYWNSCYRNPPE